MIGIYVHIPYCRTLCPYCDFVRQPIPGAVPQAYIEALCREIETFKGPQQASSVFIGGGTPSLLTRSSLGGLLDALHGRFALGGAEITLEANPDDVSEAGAASWRGLGINRVSLGVQSFDDSTLRYLGRRHDAATALRACRIVATAFENWNMDLIFGARGAANAAVSADWQATLEGAVSLAPPHVAVYGLTYESGTPFEQRAEEAVDEDTALSLYQLAEAMLDAYGHYEISNYARRGFACRHNLIYWHNEAYAGFGTGAYSYLEGVRSRNAAQTAAYLATAGTKAESQRLTDREIRIETLIQHFRLKAGLSKAYYRTRFGSTVREDFGVVLDGLLERSLLAEEVTHIRPTAEGFYLNNEIGLALVG